MPANLFSILGTIGGVAGQAIANQQNAQQNALNRQHELFMLGQQQQWAAQQAAISDMRQRALYNDLQSPEAIRKQLEKAGLSVGLMYGQGGMGGQMSSGAQADSPAAQNRGTIPMQNVFDAQTAAILADAKLKEAQTEKTESETEVNKADLPLKQKEIDVMQQNIEESKSRIEVNNSKIEEIGANIQNLLADTDLKNNQSELSKAQKAVQEAMKEWQEAQTALANIDLQYRGEYNEAMIKEIEARTQQERAAANKFYAEAKKTNTETHILEETSWYQIQQKYYECAKSAMETGTFMNGKIVEWAEAKARIDKMVQEAKSEKTINDALKECEEMFGQNGLTLLKVRAMSLIKPVGL